MQKQPETLQLELPETGTEEKKQPLNEAAIYTTWMMWDNGKLIRLLVLQKVYVAGRLQHYNMLRLFDPEITELTPEKFSELVETNKLKPWTV